MRRVVFYVVVIGQQNEGKMRGWWICYVASWAEERGDFVYGASGKYPSRIGQTTLIKQADRDVRSGISDA